MTPAEFVSYLQGFGDASQGRAPDLAEWRRIQAALASVGPSFNTVPHVGTRDITPAVSPLTVGPSAPVMWPGIGTTTQGSVGNDLAGRTHTT